MDADASMGVVSSGPPSSSALPRGIPRAVRRLRVDPPHTITVTTTISRVAETKKS